MKTRTTLIVSILLLTSLNSIAQQKFKNTLTFNEREGSPKASLADASWISGYWKGHAMGGQIEEIWSAPMGGSMMGSFKLVEDDKVVFYELETITETNGTLLLQIKHFNADLTGWEEKDKSVDFKLVKVTPDKLFFDDLTFEKLGDNEMNIYVVIEDKDGAEEVKFNYVKKPQVGF